MTDKKIKVCLVITRMDWGGSPDLVRLLATGLLADGAELTLVTGLTSHASARTAEFLKTFPGKLLVIPELQREINPWRDLSAFCKLWRFFRAQKFDIVHSHTAKAGFLARSAAYLAGCRRIVYTPHGHVFYGYFNPLVSRFFILLERLAGLYTSALVVLTAREKADHVGFRICPAEKIEIIPTCLEAEFFSPGIDRQKIREEFFSGARPLIGMVGRLEAVKGPGFFVEAAKDISGKFPNARFLLVGEGALRRELEKRVNDLGIAGRFIFTGWREDVADILSCLDVLVLPSLNEAVGLVLLQAQARGVAVVASAVGGVAEALVDGRTGILVPPADSSAIARAVAGLLADEQARRMMGRQGSEWVRGRFSAERMVADHWKLYRSLMDK